MLKRIYIGMIALLLSPMLYILALVITGTGFIYFGLQLMLGSGYAYFATGNLFLFYAYHLIRSIKRG